MTPSHDDVTADVLRGWGLPDPGESKKDRGDIVVVGGSRRTPGAVILALESTLRVGAGRAAAIVPLSIDAHLGAAIPEAAILALPDRSGDALEDGARRQVAEATAVLFGPGFDDPDETLATLRAVAGAEPRALVLDAYGLGVLPRLDRDDLPETLVLTPNREELMLLRGTDEDEALEDAVSRVAVDLRAVVTCYGVVGGPDGSIRRIEGGGPGLGTAGSGDALAGAVAGMLARGLPPERAASWGTWLHARAGDRLTQRNGLGFLARDLVAELAAAQRELDGGAREETGAEPVAGWLDRLAQPSGEVGGGAGCAVLVAVSAALLAMVAGYGEGERAQGVVTRATHVRSEAVALADRDGERSGELGAALREGGDVADAAAAAAETSVRIGELAGDLVEGWRVIAPTAKRYLHPDIVVGTQSLRAALEGLLATADADAELSRRHDGDVSDAGIERLREVIVALDALVAEFA